LIRKEPGRYLIAFGSNMRVPGMGAPRRVVEAALAVLEQGGLAFEAVSPILDTAPLGPSSRRYANAVALARTVSEPPELLALLQTVERAFGRRRRGRKWQARPLDLDIVLWSGGPWLSEGLIIPHREFRRRGFVLGPAAKIAPDWRDPLTALTLRQLFARLTRNRQLPSCDAYPKTLGGP
jgi:2-amino-4-hydroxy-6-hydroxymethyldihydropteridine diphosphokinase